MIHKTQSSYIYFTVLAKLSKNIMTIVFLQFEAHWISHLSRRSCPELPAYRYRRSLRTLIATQPSSGQPRLLSRLFSQALEENK